MAEDPGTEPDGPVDTEPQRLRRPDTRRALPTPRTSAVAGELGPPLPVVDEAAGRTGESPTDVVVSPNHIYVTVEVPGAAQETIEVRPTGRRLIVTARDARGTAYHREIPLPEPVDAESVRATYRNGVLDLSIPRAGLRPNLADGEGRDG